MAVLMAGARRWVVPMTFVCLVLGAMLGIQVHSQQQRGAMQVGRQTSALVGTLTRYEARLAEQATEISGLRARLAEYEMEAASERGFARLMTEELGMSRIALGTVAVKGPGVVLDISDSTMRGGETFGGANVYVIHDFDLLQIANELWAAGAEAVALNGQRLITGSAITCSGRLIEVNGVTIASPFTFVAIGDKQKLQSALTIRDGMLDRLRVLQFPVKLTAKDDLVLPTIAVSPKYQYAQPVDKAESSQKESSP